jgi:hypothetical protein
VNPPDERDRDWKFKSACPEPAAEPAYSEDGVDLTLIRWMLSLTPGERLNVLETAMESLPAPRDARAGFWVSGRAAPAQ